MDGIRMRRKVKERFDRLWTLDPESGCWNWRSNTARPTFWFGAVYLKTARAAWELYRGRIPNGKVVWQKCENRKCVNPKHLVLGSLSERPNRHIRERFDAKWEVDGLTGCWNWTAAMKGSPPHECGAFMCRPVGQLCAPRVAWELYVGPIPKGLEVLHECDNRKCVNPDHLFLGTQKDNMQDQVAKGRSRYGERHPMHKLSIHTVREIRDSEGTLRGIAAKFGICSAQVYRIRNRQQWSWLH